MQKQITMSDSKIPRSIEEEPVVVSQLQLQATKIEVQSAQANPDEPVELGVTDSHALSPNIREDAKEAAVIDGS